MNDTLTTDNCLLTTDGGLHWKKPLLPPRGYRSCVKYISPEILIATGPSGTDLSEDGGLHWKKISEVGFNVITTYNGKGWLAGRARIAEIVATGKK
jgi:hypothetical protein